VEIEKRAGENWRGDAGLLATSPGFEINDLGFGNRADRLEGYGEITYLQNRPGTVLRSWRVGLEPEIAWNYGGEFLGASTGIEARGELLNYWSGEIGVERWFAGYDDRLTRGGPLARSPAGMEFEASVSSDPRRGVTGEAEVAHGRDDAGGWFTSVSGGVGIKPAPNWNVTLSPTFSSQRAAAQYLANVADPLVSETYGQRYLFAPLERTTLSLRTRLNLVFQPGLSLEVYAEPFLASGAYGDPMQLAGTGEFRFIRFGVDQGSVERTPDGGYRVDPDGDGPAEPFTLRNRDFEPDRCAGTR
jgi:hypothetical protein